MLHKQGLLCRVCPSASNDVPLQARCLRDGPSIETRTIHLREAAPAQL